MTETRSRDVRAWHHNAVMMDVIDALDAWWPPTFKPLGSDRSRFA